MDIDHGGKRHAFVLTRSDALRVGHNIG